MRAMCGLREAKMLNGLAEAAPWRRVAYTLHQPWWGAGDRRAGLRWQLPDIAVPESGCCCDLRSASPAEEGRGEEEATLQPLRTCSEALCDVAATDARETQQAACVRAPCTLRPARAAPIISELAAGARFAERMCDVRRRRLPFVGDVPHGKEIEQGASQFPWDGSLALM